MREVAARQFPFARTMMVSFIGFGLLAGGCTTYTHSAPTQEPLNAAPTAGPSASPGGAAWTGTYAFEECGSPLFNGITPCWQYVVEVSSRPSSGAHDAPWPAKVRIDGYQANYRLEGHGSAGAGTLEVRFDKCDPEGMECTYANGDRLLTLVRKADGATWMRFDGKVPSGISTKELKSKDK